MAKSVRILNPLPGHSKRTSPVRAERYVADGRARFSACGKHILFIGEDHKHQMVLMLLAHDEAVAKEAALSKDSQERGYRCISRLLRLDEVRHIPFLQADQAYTLTTRPRRIGYRNGKVRIVATPTTAG